MKELVTIPRIVTQGRRAVGLGKNVYEASIERFNIIFSEFDNVWIAFSGGKDSLVMLELADYVRIKRGIKQKLKVIFYDEELISPEHEQFMYSIYNSGRFDFFWICHPLISEKFILGAASPYVQWDNSRQWVRPMPDVALKYPGHEPLTEYTIFEKVVGSEYPNSAVCIGIRTQESLTRTRGIFKAADISRPWVLKKLDGVTRAKPIYDWIEPDVFKFFYDHDIEYSPTYNEQMFTRDSFRVASPFTTEGAKKITKLKEQNPVFYGQLIKVFPEMAAQERYYKSFRDNATKMSYDVSTVAEIVEWIKSNLRAPEQRRCEQQLRSIIKIRQLEREEGRELSCYPWKRVFEAVVRGDYKRHIAPTPSGGDHGHGIRDLNIIP